MESFKIRRAEVKDACDIARVRITGWKQSYKDIVPGGLLDKLNIEADQKRVELALGDKNNKTLRFVVEDGGKIIGMGACGKGRESLDEKRGEVYAIYLLDEAKRQGIGANFMREMAEQLAANGYTSLQVNVLEQNTPARRFYEKLGGKLVKNGLFKFEGFELPDVTYVWDRIETLIKKRTLQSLLAEIELTPAFSDLDMSVNTKGIFGDVPIQIAAAWGDKEAVEILLAHGADINSVGDNGETPIFFAIQTDKEGIINLLIAHGARLDMKNNDGNTPLDLARTLDRHSIVALLENELNRKT